MNSLAVLLALSGALILTFIILVLVVICVYLRRRRRVPETSGHISGNLVQTTRREADIIRAKGELLDGDIAIQDPWGGLIDATLPGLRSCNKSTPYSVQAYPVPLGDSDMKQHETDQVGTNPIPSLILSCYLYLFSSPALCKRHAGNIVHSIDWHLSFLWANGFV